MQTLSANSSTVDRFSPPLEGEDDYARLITENLAFIERQCRRAVLHPVHGAVGDHLCGPAADGLDLENQADELLNEVLDRLRAEDFKALREFRGKAKLTTYLTTIVSNLVVDLVRQKKGRSRAKERAREMGAVAERLYELVFSRGCTLDQAHSHLAIDHGLNEPLEKLQEMLDRMRGRSERSQMLLASDPEAVWLVPGRKLAANDAVEIVVADPRKNAEAALIEGQRESRAHRVVSGLLETLTGEEKFLLRLRYPADDSEPKTCKEIGTLLGATENSVDGRIRRILFRFKETLLRQGMSLGDFT